MSKQKNKKKTGWSKDHWVLHCSCGDHNSFWKSIVTSKEWASWKKEIYNRMHRGDYKHSFDVDECEEVNIISPEHWTAFCKFIRRIKEERWKKK
jgi:outer membrane receptor for ferric coprogen and ferric-rhodotorulic acid